MYVVVYPKSCRQMMNGNDDDISEILYFHPFRDSSIVNALYGGESESPNENSQIIKIIFLIKWIFLWFGLALACVTRFSAFVGPGAVEI